MGYDIHITRKKFWADDENPELDISLEEWITYVNSDKELLINPNAYTRRKNDSDDLEGSTGFAEWIAGPDIDEAWFDYAFDYAEGRIHSKNPVPETITKMKKIAIALNAKVIGDDGEIYDLYSEKIFFPKGHSYGDAQKPWWKFW
jgi:hypothetical protein